ncbi:uncharacterized protein LOC131013221 [Salvia miltiorrhiza]|uniref:uncharacterized protein LOC131013221 n=1 Tax=Salvia miltiorrhiza TaxID=226208 RepID=UPI0025AB7EF7|nr:uncharacterized protein LOC131013221 [Salvia miltiorrhiza]
MSLCIIMLRIQFVELHGDRAGYDDPAVSPVNGRSYMFVGHQKGRNTKENIQRNYPSWAAEKLKITATELTKLHIGDGIIPTKVINQLREPRSGSMSRNRRWNPLAARSRSWPPDKHTFQPASLNREDHCIRYQFREAITKYRGA